MPTPDDTVPIDSLSDPETLRDRGVRFDPVERSLEREQFEGLRERYDAIAGVVQVGLTTDDGRVLLEGSTESGGWAPPGGSVDPGEDWVASARSSMERQTGTDVEIDGAVLVEELTFRLEGDPDESFAGYGVTFAASLASAADAFVENPTIVDHPLLPEDHDRTFEWFEAVPEDVNENHAEHVALFL